MPWNYIKCENYGSFAACRNRETTEPGIFMLPAFWRFFKLFLYAPRQPSLVNDLFRGKPEVRRGGWSGLVGVERRGRLAMRYKVRALDFLSLSDLVTPDSNSFFFLIFFQVCTFLISHEGCGPSRALQGVHMSTNMLWVSKSFSIQVSPAVIFVTLKPCFYGVHVQQPFRGLHKVRSVF